MKLILSILCASLLIGIFALATGAYNIAATDKHWIITEKIIAWMRDSSIKARASDINVPPLDDVNLLLTGAEHYNAMCTVCHLSPGQKPTELALGLYPHAPIFHEKETLVDEEEKMERIQAYFWVIKNGLKMTAMPAWGLTHYDDEIWAMTAFVLQLSGMTSGQYQDFISSGETHDHDENSHQH